MSQKNNLLKKFNPNTCNLCDGSGWKVFKKGDYYYSEPCKCVRRNIKAQVFGEKFRDCTLENYQEKNQSMKVARQSLLKNRDKSFFIYGNVDLGKTHLLSAFYEYQFEKGFKRIKTYKEAQLKFELQGAAVGSYGWKENPKEAVKNILKDADAIFIDDIAKVNVEDKMIEALYTFYNTAYEREIQLVVSSNYALSSLPGSDDPSVARIYGAPIASRIERICSLIHIQDQGDFFPDLKG